MPASATPHVRQTDARPTGRQWWRIAHAALALLEIRPPATRAEASALIDRLETAGRIGSDGDAPF